MMVNHPILGRRNAIVRQLKSLIRSASEDQIIDLVSGRSAIAVFPRARPAVHLDHYFAQDVPDGAAEQYWRNFGSRATLMLEAFSNDLYELPLDWRNQLECLIQDDEELSCGLSAIRQMVALGLAHIAEASRRALLHSNLADAVINALIEISDMELNEKDD